MTQVIRLELRILNSNKYDSCITFEGDCNGYGDYFVYHADSFEEGLRNALLQAFDDMWNNLQYRIHRLKCSGSVILFKRTGVASLLSDIIHLNTENMEILTRRGYMTFSSFKEGAMSNISHVLMLLVWKRSRHFVNDNMDGTNDFSSSTRACVVCGKVHHGVRTGQHVGGIRSGVGPSSVREVIAHPYKHCFNPKCFSHEIERMIDPTYVFVPPKPGEDPETDFAQIIPSTWILFSGDIPGKPVKKDHPVGTGVVKKNHDDNPAVKRFLKDME